MLQKHPFRRVALELTTQHVATEMPLMLLSRECIGEFLEIEFPGHEFPPDLGDVLHARTEGNPLFMADLVRDLRSRGVIVQESNRWVLSDTVVSIGRDLPASIRSLIQRKMDQLAEEHRRLLTVAAVQGQEFDSAVVATVLAADAESAEEMLLTLEQTHALVRKVRT